MVVNLKDYSGLWYEIARTSNSFEKECDFATAQYTYINENSLNVVNSCYKNGELINTVKGKANTTFRSNALRVEFEGVPKIASVLPNYFIVDTDYTSYSIVRGRFGKAWILSREPLMSKEKFDTLLNKLPLNIQQSIKINKITF